MGMFPAWFSPPKCMDQMYVNMTKPTKPLIYGNIFHLVINGTLWILNLRRNKACCPYFFIYIFLN